MKQFKIEVKKGNVYDMAFGETVFDETVLDIINYIEDERLIPGEPALLFVTEIGDHFDIARAAVYFDGQYMEVDKRDIN